MMLTRDGDAKTELEKVTFQTIRSSSIGNGNGGGIDRLYPLVNVVGSFVSRTSLV